ncbi:hypothetical protein ASPVEDRAFT_888642 [Aspergillus versicolor CBS 583.65]|uniref:Ecp2 effector protein domain-containing protein n=1 Tax=Aspergillus versicolor CBS 583.65 TaxID=1036611 RepID=A0A1L9PMD1_ASPVE|nr:uncharacterized protein ASPVEDRAFT_888642 [Aspergillus versicolor CBS 583.65]OJJ02596.1 hypothetical protein ASPVEDRAFT_888642 [Aspergillus versicolor CBS 583.65]
MYRFVVTTFLALLALTASAIPAFRGSNLGDTVSIFRTKAYPDGPDLILNGTVTEVYAQLKEINPNFDEDFKDVRTVMDEISTTDLSDPVSELETHILSKRHTLNCISHDEADDASVDHIRGGISHLRSTKGKPTLAAGKCERVSCEWGDAILWCNDAPKTRSLPSYNNIADGAQTIMDGCYKRGESLRGFGGSLNHPDKWRVIVDGYKYRVNLDWKYRYNC